MSTSQTGTKHAGGWQPPSLDEMQAVLPQYRFEGLLGRGGMGAVYKAVQSSLDRTVAIKVLPGDLIDDENAQFAERFKNEARTMAKMSHPNIVNVYDFGETQSGLFYFVMEFIDGTDVAQMIAGQGCLPEDYALSITAHVCDALAYAHARGVIHRDIKPANILLNMEGTVKVADFGLAKQSDAGQNGLTKTNMAMGTPDFVAPEALIPGMPLDGRADLYATGVMLYQMLTGEIPRGMWTMPGFKRGTDPRFDAIIAKAMQTDREARYQSAQDLRRDLDTILALPRAVLIQRQQEAAEAAAQATRAQRAAEMADSQEKAATPTPASKTVTAGQRPRRRAGLVISLIVLTALGAGAFVIFGGGQKPKSVAPAKIPAGEVPKPPAVSSPKPPAATASKPVVAAPAPAAFTEPVPVVGKKSVDLLPRIDLAKDAVLGIWNVRNGELVYTSQRGATESRVQIPVGCTGSYTLDVELSTHAISGDVALFLPFKGKGDALENVVFLVSHNNKGNHRAGFAHFQGLPSFAPNTPAWAKLDSALGPKSRITVQVLLKSADRLALKAWVNGKPLVAWEGPRSDTTGGSRVWRPATHGYFAVGTQLKDTTFHRVRLEPMDGEVEWLRTPAPPSTPSPTAMVPSAPATAMAPPSPADPVSARLVTLEKTFLEAYEQQAGAVHKTAVADLNAKYAAALDRGIATAAKSGKLDEALALRNEKVQIQTDAAVPEADGENTPASLQTLRKTWRDQMAALIAKRNQSAAPLHASYDRALAAYQDELTKVQKLDDAMRVKAVRDHVAQQRDPAAPAGGVTAVKSGSTPADAAGGARAPAAPPLSADKVLPPLPKATPEEVRAVCEWALDSKGGAQGRGGHVQVAGGGPRIDQVKDLPKGTLKLTEFSLYELPMNEEGLKWFSILGRCPDLERLIFSNNPGTMPVEMLRGATKLKSLHIKPTEVEDAAFAHLSGLKSLEILSVDYRVRNFTGEGLGYLNEGLLELFIDSPALTEKGMAYLPRFKKLRRLAFNNSSAGGRCMVTDTMLKSLAALPELAVLDLTNTRIDGSFLVHMPANSKLRELYLDRTQNFQAQHLVHLGKFKKLQKLSLPPVAISPEVMAFLAGLDELVELVIEGNRSFSGESFKGQKGFRSLETLILDDSALSDAGLAAIGEAVPDLKDFRMSCKTDQGTTCTAAGFGVLAGRLKSLTTLNLTDKGVTDDFMPHVGRLKNVTYMVLVDASITDAGLPHLKNLPVGYFRLSGTQITDAALPVLKTFPKITNVVTDRTKLTAAGRAELDKIEKENQGR